MEKELIELVIEEAKNLRAKALPVELKNLDLETLNPTSMYMCIYGQMTGNCFSDRASSLIKKCCSRAFMPMTGSPANGMLNGKPKGNRSFFSVKFWSPIEVFIDKNKHSPDNNKPLVQFLKGEIDLSTFKKHMKAL